MKIRIMKFLADWLGYVQDPSNLRGHRYVEVRMILPTDRVPPAASGCRGSIGTMGGVIGRL